MKAQSPSNRQSTYVPGSVPAPPRNATARPVQRRLLVPLIAVLLLLVGGFSALLLHVHQRGLDQASRWLPKTTSDELKETLRQQSASLKAIGDLLLRDQGLIEALKARDRERLLKGYESIFAKFRAEYGISHFYFHRPDRVNLLRVHKPSKNGDLIDRFTLREAERTREASSGIEFGPFGTFTLRVVMPAFDGDTLVGYLELGKEIEDILKGIAEHNEIELAVAIWKEALDRETWEAGMKMLGRDADWDRFASVTIIYSSQPHFPTAAEHLLGEGNHDHGDLIALNIDGRPWNCLAIPLSDASGAEVGDLLVFHDISETVAQFNFVLAVSSVAALALAALLVGFLYIVLRRVDRGILAREADLAKSEAFQRTLIETSPDFIYVLGRDMVIRTVNRPQAGRCTEDVVGRSALSLVSPGYQDQLRAAFDQALEEGVMRAAETGVHLPDGEHFFLNRLNPLPGGDEQRAVVLIATEITERKRVEQQLERYSEELEGQKAELEAQHNEIIAVNASLTEAFQRADSATRAKSEFLANMSHEIRTPMTAILGFAENLLDADQSETERLKCIHIIRRNGDYLLEIINDILDLSKIEAGKMTIERGDCHPCRVVAEVASLMSVRAEAKGLPFDIKYIGVIPETIQSDATRLRQILINLIGNAIKFTEVGFIRLVTRFVDDGDEPSLQFDVIDTGRGMTEKQRDKLFQPFMQADSSTTRQFGGTGLGLTISKRFAELLGGGIAVVATGVGVGTIFRASLATGSLDGVKMLDDPTSATMVVPEGSAGLSPGGAARAEACVSSSLDCRILLAEDGPDNQRLIAFILKKAGADVTVVENGKLALDAALAARDEGQPFDIILMDMQMPVMDGYEATGQLRLQGCTGPIIALTANAMTGDREKCIKAGCDDYATKPINRKKLIETIQQWLGASIPV